MSPGPERPAAANWLDAVEFVFLVGCPRSGTTWLQALLACHPAVATGPETHFFSSFAAARSAFLEEKERRAGLQEYWRPEDFHAELRGLFTRVLSRLPAPRVQPRFFLEKTPQHGEHARFILETLPGARFVHLVRDARAVVASLLRASKGWGRSWAPSTVDAATHLWLHHVREARGIRELAPDRYLEVRYEDLRRDPTGGLRRLFAWLELEADERLVLDAVAANSLENARSEGAFDSIPRVAGGVLGPSYPEGFVGEAPLEPEHVALSRMQRRRVERFAAPLLRELGYPGSAPGLGLGERLLAARPLRRLLGLPSL